MKSLLVVLAAVLLTIPSCAISHRTALADVQGVEVSYQAPMLAVEIKNGLLSYTRQVDVKYARPWSDVPVSSREKTGGGRISDEEVRALLDAADGCGFFALNDAYGAPGEERSYAYEISITRNGRKKTVLFRSNPSYADAPSCFVTLQEKITALAGK